jgi:hypothetical protein
MTEQSKLAKLNMILLNETHKLLLLFDKEELFQRQLENVNKLARTIKEISKE